jgi:hypothetical protein
LLILTALGHAYFNGPYVSPKDGSEHATRTEALKHIPLSLISPVSAVTADMQIDRSSEYDSNNSESNKLNENDDFKGIEGTEGLIPLSIDELCDAESIREEKQLISFGLTMTQLQT